MLHHSRYLLLKTLLVGALATLTCARLVAAAPSKTLANTKTNTPIAADPAPVEITIPKSHFASQLEGGKDPFYPTSARFEPKPPPSKPGGGGKVVPVVPDLKINGFSGNASRPLAIINNVTFGVGDEQAVTSSAGRTQVRCIEIRTEDQAVVIEINGQRRELKFEDRK